LLNHEASAAQPACCPAAAQLRPPAARLLPSCCPGAAHLVLQLQRGELVERRAELAVHGGRQGVACGRVARQQGSCAVVTQQLLPQVAGDLHHVLGTPAAPRTRGLGWAHTHPAGPGGWGGHTLTQQDPRVGSDSAAACRPSAPFLQNARLSMCWQTVPTTPPPTPPRTPPKALPAHRVPQWCWKRVVDSRLWQAWPISCTRVRSSRHDRLGRPPSLLQLVTRARMGRW
jgi:hypothetical protein